MSYHPPETPWICRECGGPCATWKGSVHRWTCRTCLARYLAESIARRARRDQAELDKRARKATRVWDQVSEKLKLVHPGITTAAASSGR